MNNTNYKKLYKYCAEHLIEKRIIRRINYLID